MNSMLPLFKQSVLRNLIRKERAAGIRLPSKAQEIVAHWNSQLQRGVLAKLTESSIEQTFTAEIFGKLLGYRQIGEANEASLMPKRAGQTGRDFPDFVLGRFDPAAGVEDWIAVVEVKGVATDLDHPQSGRANNETPVEQAFRYATRGRAGVEWVLVSNFSEVRLYKNGYSGAYHSWRLKELADEHRLYEFYILLRPEGLVSRLIEPVSTRAFRDTIAAGRALTEGFYGLYKLVQQELIKCLEVQAVSKPMTTIELYGKTHKLLNRILFVGFCEKHPAGLVPRDTLKQVAHRGRQANLEGGYWSEYKKLFRILNEGGGIDGVAYNAFNGGLFAHDPYFDRITIPDRLFVKRFRAGTGKRQSLEIVGIFGFDIYDFSEDLNVQALGAIFEQSLKDISQGEGAVRGFGKIDVSKQEVGGVYYTPVEITSYLVRRAQEEAFKEIEHEVREEVKAKRKTRPVASSTGRARKEVLFYDLMTERLKKFKIMDPACGSGAFLVEALDQLHRRYDRLNRAAAELLGERKQLSILDLDRIILRDNLYGRDLLPESVEISRLSIWLRTAKKSEKLESLDRTITVGDTLRATDTNKYDVVVGNPPWGANLEGWSDAELRERFPFSGGEKDSYALFAIRAQEMLRANGILAFILPNSWLTVGGYEPFRAWFLKHFSVIEITNVWKVFRDVNHDACMVVARKRADVVRLEVKGTPNGKEKMVIQSIERGLGESGKLKRIAEENWTIAHAASHEFQFKQPLHRLEVIYPPRVAAELDRIARGCAQLDTVASVTVGIQVYHHSRVPQTIIKNRAFHSTSRKGKEWYPYIDANDVQRYFVEPSDTQWLLFSDRLRDKRELSHYEQPRILIQQIFWRRLSACIQEPKSPLLYLNTLFAIYEPRKLPLAYLLGIINSRFTSASYERRANRLFGDKFPKVSKADLATIPIPKLDKTKAGEIAELAISLQSKWEDLRAQFQQANGFLLVLSGDLSLSSFGDFWELSANAFVSKGNVLGVGQSVSQIGILKKAHALAKGAVDKHWHSIAGEEEEMERLVRHAYGLSSELYQLLTADTPKPTVDWALRP